MSEDWRVEEEEYTRAAAEQWAHGRGLVDVARELMHRGDTVAVAVGGHTFAGLLVHVGDDLLTVRTPSGPVDVHLALARAGADMRVPAPLVIRVVERARAGGRAGGGPATFRARLLEHETDRVEVVMGSLPIGEELRGTLTVGRDHVRLCDRDGRETLVPLAWVSWVRAGTL